MISSDQRLSASFKYRLKTILSDFHWSLIRPAASASKVMTVWRYINSIIIIIIIIPSVYIPEVGFKN